MSPVRVGCVPGPWGLRPWSEGVASPVREMCRDPRRQNAPKADYRPRSRELRPRSVGVASPVCGGCIPGPGGLCPRSVGVASQVREKCRDPRRQNAPKADYRPRSQRKVRTCDGTAVDKGHLCGDLRRQSPQKRPITVPGQRELRPWSVGVASPVRRSCVPGP